MRADVLRMDELSNQAKFLYHNNLKTIDDLMNYKDDIKFKINQLLDQRERLWARRKLSKDENTRLSITEEISSLNDKLIKYRKKVETCEDIEKRLPKIDSNLEELDKNEELERDTKANKKVRNKKGKE